MSFLQYLNTSERSSVQVAVRVRPINAREAESELITRIHDQTVTIINPDDKTTDDKANKKFTYDFVYGSDAGQEAIHSYVGEQVLHNTYRGYNSCVFAYGQTGCFAYDTMIKLLNGSSKPVQDIDERDVLIGDDNKPRHILALYNGIEQMYRISAVDLSAEAYDVNESHIMTVIKQGTVNIIDVPLTNLLADKTQKYYGIRINRGIRYYYQIKITKLNKGSYYGFQLDANGRFQHASGIVLHNSGKTHTMTGSPSDLGIIPRICQALFDRQQTHNDIQQGDCSINYKVQLSYLEIYSEEVKDLLRRDNPPGGLTVRQHPEYGPYVENLTQLVVEDYKSIKRLIDQGNKERSTAATLMNSRSSRSHAILTLTFTQIITDLSGSGSDSTSAKNKKKREVVSKINLVDLAGSERVEQSGVTGVNFKEAIMINKSLSALGLVISKLATKSQASQKTDQKTKTKTKPKIDRQIDQKPKTKHDKDKHDKDHIPFRDSVLTWILRESLGGNSKTYMIATISPASINYSETLNTLRYAYNAKQIVNVVKVNEDPNDKIIRVLKDEITILRDKLKSINLGSGSHTGTAANSAEIKKLRDEITQREELMHEKEKSWEQKLEESRAAERLAQEQLKQELNERQVEFKRKLDLMNEERAALLLEMERMRGSLSEKDNEQALLVNELSKTQRKQDEFEKSKLIETAISLQEIYEKKLDILKLQYEEKLQAQRREENKTTNEEIERLKTSNQQLKDNLNKSQVDLQVQMRQFTTDRAVLAKQIQQLQSKIQSLEHEIRDTMTNSMNKSPDSITRSITALNLEYQQKTEEYNQIKQRRDDEEKRYIILQKEYQTLINNIRENTERLSELNQKHEEVRSELERETTQLTAIKQEYQELRTRFEKDRDEYNELLIKKEELHTEISQLTAALDVHLETARVQLKNPSLDDLVKIQSGFENLLTLINGRRRPG